MKKLLFAYCLIAMSMYAQEKPMKAYMVADAHLDTQWNWDVQTTIKEYIWNTMVQNFHLFQQYPNYIFNFEGGVKYAWMKEYYPLQYEEVKHWVNQGRWHLTGSSWDACEAIVCSPESWIRNVLLGQTFYRQEFGKEGTDIFLPDCFGFPYTMPTLARHCGLIGFSSQKLVWRTKPFYDGDRRYPFTFGRWKGIDGSEIFMAHGFGYAERYPYQDLSHNKTLLREVKESPQNVAYRYYGTGDIGGSPTISSVRAVEKGIKGDGPVQIISATSDQLYKEFMPIEQHPELPQFDGELYMDLHGNGCYTSQAAMKLYNRQNEHLGDAAERAAVMADCLGAYKYPIGLMTDAWRRIIWHQFHDDLTGTSIPRAYEFSWNDELLSLKQFSDVLTTSIGGVARQMDTKVSGTPIVVYNNESFPVTSIVKMQMDPLPSHVGKGQGWGQTCPYSVTDANGKSVNAQMTADGQLLFEATVPATGMAVYSVKPNGKQKSTLLEGICNPPVRKENSIYRITVDANGDITSLYDKRAQKELVADGQYIRLVILDDCRSERWPAWEIQKHTLDKAPVPIHDDVEVSITEDGPLRKTISISKRYGPSVIRQLIHLYEGSEADRIDFENIVDWKSENALLKAEFPLSISNPNASYDLGLGKVERGNNRENQYEVYSHEWTDLTDRSGNYGLTILNDSRYGWDKPSDNTLHLSLLYAPKTGRSYAYQAHQDKGHHVFTYSLIGHQGTLDVTKTVQRATLLNSPLRAFAAPKHKGELGRSFSFVQSDNDNVIIRTMKRAEVSDEYVVRVHELSGKAEQKATLTFASDIVQAVEADGTEQTLQPATYTGHNLQVTIKPFSVKTYKVKLKPLCTMNSALGFAASLVEELCPLPLPYDRACATFNEFRSEANFEGGYSYAAELLPEDGKLVVDGIPFQLGERDGLNGLSCKGDTLQLMIKGPQGRLRSGAEQEQSTGSLLEGVCNHLYLLAASDLGDRIAEFCVGTGVKGKGVKGDLQSVKGDLQSPVTARLSCEVPFYSGFIGQWGHDGQTRGYLKQGQVAYVGTHRHSPMQDEPYEYTYMFKLRLDIPKGATHVILPNDPHIVIFAATLANDDEGVTPVSKHFETSNIDDNSYKTVVDEAALPTTPSLLKDAKIVSFSGYVNNQERPEYLTDGNPETKWCDTNPAPNYVTFDLGALNTVSRWHLLNAGSEMSAYITRTCLLQGKANEGDEWQTLDIFDGNRLNETDRTFTPAEVRFVRLFVVGPTQGAGNDATRIYTFDLW